MARSSKAQRFQINNFSKLSLVPQSDGRWAIYLLKKGEKSKIIRRFAKDRHHQALQYCEDMAETFGRLPTKVTLVEPNVPEELKMSEFDQYRANKIEFVKKELEKHTIVNKELFVDILEIMLLQHRSIVRLARDVQDLTLKVLRLERERDVGES